METFSQRFKKTQFIEAASKGDGIVTLKCYRNPLKEEAGFAGSPDIDDSRLPISNRKLTPSSFIGPGVSTAIATKSYLCFTPVYFAIFRSESSSAAAPLTQDVFGRCDCAKVSGMVKSQVQP